MNKKEVKKSLENKFNIGDKVYFIKDGTFYMGLIGSAKLTYIASGDNTKYVWSYEVTKYNQGYDTISLNSIICSASSTTSYDNSTLKYTSVVEDDLFATFEEVKAEYIKREKEKRKGEFAKTLLSFLGVSSND